MAYDTPYIGKKTTKTIDTTILLYFPAEVIGVGIYYILSSPTSVNFIAQQIILNDI